MTKEKYTNFNWNAPRVIATLPKGKGTEILYNALQNQLRNFPVKDWSILKFNADSHEIYGSNNIEPGVINYLLRDYGVRVAVPRDNINEDISNLINGKHYTDFNANVIYQSKPSYEKNDGLWKKVIELAEEKKVL